MTVIYFTNRCKLLFSSSFFKKYAWNAVWLLFKSWQYFSLNSFYWVVPIVPSPCQSGGNNDDKFSEKVKTFQLKKNPAKSILILKLAHSYTRPKTNIQSWMALKRKSLSFVSSKASNLTVLEPSDIFYSSISEYKKFRKPTLCPRKLRKEDQILHQLMQKNATPLI